MISNSLLVLSSDNNCKDINEDDKRTRRLRQESLSSNKGVDVQEDDEDDDKERNDHWSEPQSSPWTSSGFIRLPVSSLFISGVESLDCECSWCVLHFSSYVTGCFPLAVVCVSFFCLPSLSFHVPSRPRWWWWWWSASSAHSFFSLFSLDPLSPLFLFLFQLQRHTFSPLFFPEVTSSVSSVSCFPWVSKVAVHQSLLFYFLVSSLLFPCVFYFLLSSLLFPCVFSTCFFFPSIDFLSNMRTGPLLLLKSILASLE